VSTIDQQFVEFIVKSLVGNPDDVAIERTIDEKGVLLKLTVNSEDLGRVIGKRGSTAQSIRTLLRALGTKNDARYNLKIIDPEGDNRPPRTDATTDDTTSAPVLGDNDVVEEDKSEAPVEVVDTPIEEVVEKPTAEEPVVEEPTSDSLADKTRKELAELDDLDI
jgi:hypothetical protein